MVDEIARERMEELTESGSEAGEVGVLPQDAGQDDTSRPSSPAESGQQPTAGRRGRGRVRSSRCRPQQDDEGV